MVREGSGFLWFGKSKLNLRGEKTAIFAALDHKRGDFFATLFGDSASLVALHFEGLDAFFVFITHGLESSESFIKLALDGGMILRALVSKGEKGEDLSVGGELFFHDLLCHKAREAQTLFYSFLSRVELWKLLCQVYRKDFFLFS